MKPESPAAATPIQSPKLFSQEVSFAAGIGLALSGQFPILLLGGAAGWLLRRLKPAVPLEVLYVTSINLALMILVLNASMNFVLAPALIAQWVAAFVFTVFLFVSGGALWAWLLILHSVWVIVQQVFEFQAEEIVGRERGLIGAMALQALLIWILARYLRRPTILEKVEEDSWNTLSDTKGELNSVPVAAREEPVSDPAP